MTIEDYLKNLSEDELREIVSFRGNRVYKTLKALADIETDNLKEFSLTAFPGDDYIYSQGQRHGEYKGIYRVLIEFFEIIERALEEKKKNKKLDK